MAIVTQTEHPSHNDCKPFCFVPIRSFVGICDPVLKLITHVKLLLLHYVLRSWSNWVQCLTTDCDTGRPGFDPGRNKGFPSSLCVHTSSEAHPAFYPVCIGGTFPAGKARPGREAGHSLHLEPRSRISRNYISSSPCHLHGGIVTALLYIIFCLLYFQILPSIQRSPDK
jgi:hypothetical protein